MSEVLYIYSGKGGVGKTTTSVNLAYTLMNLGYRVLLIDGDINTPNIPVMLKRYAQQQTETMSGFRVRPRSYQGLDVISTDLLTAESEDLYLSGKYLEGAIKQLIASVTDGHQDNKDFVLVDLPPGTTEIHRYFFNHLPGNIIYVTTSTQLSFQDYTRAATFIKRLNMNLLCLVMNMVSQTKEHDQRLFQAESKKVCGTIPRNEVFSICLTKGEALVMAKPDHVISEMYRSCAKKILERLQCFGLFGGANSEERLLAKPIYHRLGFLSDELLYDVLFHYWPVSDWSTYPFVNINNQSVVINKRSETSRKAIIEKDGQHYFLKQLPWYCSTEQIHNSMQLQRHLQANGIAIPDFIANNEGEVLTEVKGKWYFLQTYITEKSWSDSDHAATDQAIDAAATIGRIHNASLSGHLIPLPKKTIFDDARLMMGLLAQERRGEVMIDHYCKKIAKHIAVLSAKEATVYARSAVCVHGDCNPFNFIFSLSRSVSAVLDFDNSCIDHPVHDVAEMLVNFCFLTFRNQVMRYGRPKLQFDESRAVAMLRAYGGVFNGNFLEVLFLLRNATVTVSIELFTLGLIRQDYDASIVKNLFGYLSFLDGHVGMITEQLTLVHPVPRIKRIGFWSANQMNRENQDNRSDSTPLLQWYL